MSTPSISGGRRCRSKNSTSSRQARPKLSRNVSLISNSTLQMVHHNTTETLMLSYLCRRLSPGTQNLGIICKVAVLSYLCRRHSPGTQVQIKGNHGFLCLFSNYNMTQTTKGGTLSILLLIYCHVAMGVTTLILKRTSILHLVLKVFYKFQIPNGELFKIAGGRGE